VDVPLDTLNLEPLVQDALLPLQREIARRQAEVRIQHPLLPVRGNPLMFRQVVSNLLGNALKFIPAGVMPKVEVWTERRDHAIRLLVKDNGIGIPQKYSAKLFQPFVRLVRQDEYPGTGIGLAIVRKAVERMGGLAGFDSESGRGSVFWVEVPQAPGTNRSEPANS
jgi:signal transduction histidine kinase